MDKTRFETGLENLKKIDGAGGCEPQLEIHINGALNAISAAKKLL